MVSMLLTNATFVFISFVTALSLVSKTNTASKKYEETRDSSIINGYFDFLKGIVYTNTFLYLVFFVNSFLVTLLFLLKYWLVAKKVTMINRKTEDKWLQHKIYGIFIFVTLFILA